MLSVITCWSWSKSVLNLWSGFILWYILCHFQLSDKLQLLICFRSVYHHWFGITSSFPLWANLRCPYLIKNWDLCWYVGESHVVSCGDCNENVCLSSIVHYSKAKWRVAKHFSGSAAPLTVRPLPLRPSPLNQADHMTFVLIVSPDWFDMIWVTATGAQHYEQANNHPQQTISAC